MSSRYRRYAAFTEDCVPGQGMRQRAAWPLAGRQKEQQALAGLVADVAAGRSQVLGMQGVPVMGKSALLDWAAGGPARGCRVERVAGVQSELEFPYAGLHQLSLPLLGHLGA